MKPHAARVLAEALSLPLDERADLAGHILHSLDEGNEALSADAYDLAWGAEITRRSRELDDGSVKPMNTEQALQLIASDDPALDK